MKKILILNGSPRKKCSTASLIDAFADGAESVGNEVNNMYLNSMDISGCLACEKCSQNGGDCIQKDDMEMVKQAFEWADVVVFASPQFWGTFTGQLKIVIDRIYAEMHRMGFPNFKKETALIMTARGDNYRFAFDFYNVFVNMLGWKDHGTVLGAGKEDDARKIGEIIE